MTNILLKPDGKTTRLFVMKKDSELPWAIRIARWGAVILFLAYAVLTVIEKAKEVLL